MLINNSFCFNGKYYKQRRGMALGRKFAHVYDTMVRLLEKPIYKRVTDEFGDQFGEYFKEFLFRFLDDCFAPWTISITDLYH